MKTTRWLGIAATVGAAGAASAVIIRHDKEDALYQTLAANAKYNPVGLFEYESDSSTGYATANYIGVGTGGKKWIVSAAHVFSQDMNKAKFTVGGKTYDVEISSLRWRTEYESGKGDIAIGRVLDPDGTLTMAPAKYWKGRIPVPKDLGDHLIGTAVGFGMTGTGNTGENAEDKKKRGFQNRIDALDLPFNNGGDSLYGYISDFDNNTAGKNSLNKADFPAANFNDGQISDKTWLDLEGQGAHGDSGGGLFAEIGGQTVMIGINSVVSRLGTTVAASTTHYGAYDQFAPFDDEYSGRVKGWTGIEGVPEPTTVTAVGLGILALFRRRRK